MNRKRVERLAAEQAGVVSLSQAYALGTTRAEVRAHVRAARWRRHGSQSIVVHRGPLTQEARFWAAVFEAGPRAQLDGESSLLAGGLRNYESTKIRVSVPRGARVRRARGLDIRQTRRWDAGDVFGRGVPRTRNEVAAVRAALWARSNKQATLLLTMAVQQGLTTAERLGTEMLRVRKAKRRWLVHAVILDLLGGVRSLGELEFARECRRRGLPEPTRQVLRRDARNRYYLDLYWPEWKLVVEIDGIHHAWAENVVGDALRQNALALDGDTVLRLPLLGYRLQPDDFFAQIEQGLRAAGWAAAA